MEPDEQSPRVIVIGGPNGAGKSTVAARLIPACVEFVNADEIAKTLAETVTDSVNVQAGRLMLGRLDEIEAARADIALETTLASRTLAPRIRRLQQNGYRFTLYYVWVPSPDLSIERVAERVRSGGHFIPEDVIRRRYANGLSNFFNIYQPMADRWVMYNNSVRGNPRTIARGATVRRDNVLWQQIRQENLK